MNQSRKNSSVGKSKTLPCIRWRAGGGGAAARLKAPGGIAGATWNGTIWPMEGGGSGGGCPAMDPTASTQMSANNSSASKPESCSLKIWIESVDLSTYFLTWLDHTSDMNESINDNKKTLLHMDAAHA